MKNWIRTAATIASLTIASATVFASSEHDRFPGMEGAQNFRDLGGYTTQEGKTVKWGKIYRSNALDKLTDSDQELLKELNIGTVCDLRDEKELAKSPDRLPEDSDIDYINLNIQEALAKATGKKIDESAMLALQGKSNEEIEVLGNELMENAYAGFALYAAPLYAKIFAQLLDDEHALVFHCQAGKDRAGVGSALILLALGVDEATILEDYMISGKVWTMPDSVVEQYAAHYGVDPIVMKQFMGTRISWMQSAFNAIKSKYGSYDAYFEEALQLDQNKLAKLRSLYLE
ncbi:tyrosine-protein phosphatase [Pelagicoccus albus]|uniref:Tyrosine-protein phosphatase n=1 Tax=Pelagicoccus albus TaxID=415222 RepID=A0A7X1B472_9BACT|nr:tyrosine-protein phosphatase [Pelagicoccus albus]MBC2605094.1 tyrosine-protein phosphatase [Pelagicoccus albus]